VHACARVRACSFARGAAESKEERARVTPGQRRRERHDDGWESRGRSRIRAARACISRGASLLAGGGREGMTGCSMDHWDCADDVASVINAAAWDPGFMDTRECELRTTSSSIVAHPSENSLFPGIINGEIHDERAKTDRDV